MKNLFHRLKRIFWKATNTIWDNILRQSIELIRNRILHRLIWRWWFGYGERPFRVIVTVAVLLVVTWLCYWQLGSFVLDEQTSPPSVGRVSWDEALYYSLISFSALGYGGWVAEPTGWAQWVGAVQPFVGIISVIALSISLTQRQTRE